MKHYCVIETKEHHIPSLLKNFGYLTQEVATTVFEEWVCMNMKNLGYYYFGEPIESISFIGKGFYSYDKPQKSVSWQRGSLEIFFENSIFNLQVKF